MTPEEKILQAFNMQSELLEKQGEVILDLKSRVDSLEEYNTKIQEEYLKLYTVFQSRLVELEKKVK